MKKLLIVLFVLCLSSNSIGQNYSVFYTKGYRYDKAHSWVVIGTDAKGIVNSVYHKLGTKKFSLLIVSDKQAAEYAKMEEQMSHLTNSQSSYLEKHTIATFDGELDTYEYKYSLDYKGITSNYEPK